MSEEKKGIVAIEAILVELGEIAVIAKKISADGKLSVEDIGHAIELGKRVPSIMAAVKLVDEAVLEAKDIDVAEVISLIQSVAAKVKAVEKA